MAEQNQEPVGGIDNLDLPVTRDARWILSKLEGGLSPEELIAAARTAEQLAMQSGGIIVCKSHLIAALGSTLTFLQEQNDA